MAACRDSTGACRRATAHTDQPEPERRRASMRVNASCHTRPRACAFRRPRVRTCDPPSDRVEFLHRPPPHPCRLAALPRCVLLTVRGCAPPCFSLVCGKTLFVVRTRRKKKSSENSYFSSGRDRKRGREGGPGARGQCSVCVQLQRAASCPVASARDGEGHRPPQQGSAATLRLASLCPLRCVGVQRPIRRKRRASVLSRRSCAGCGRGHARPCPASSARLRGAMGSR